MLIKRCNKLTVYKFKFLSDAPDDILLLPVCCCEVPGGREEGGGRRVLLLSDSVVIQLSQGHYNH